MGLNDPIHGKILTKPTAHDAACIVGAQLDPADVQRDRLTAAARRGKLPLAFLVPALDAGLIAMNPGEAVLVSLGVKGAEPEAIDERVRDAIDDELLDERHLPWLAGYFRP